MLRPPSKKEEVHFDNIDYYLTQCLQKCRESLKVCVAWISWDRYALIFKRLAEKGATVEIIFNNDPKNSGASRLQGIPGITLYPVNTRRKNSIMHNKFCIIDDTTLLTGSFNWSRNAATHFENILILYNHFDVIKEYKHEFEDLKWYYDFYSIAENIVCGSKEEGSRHPCKSTAYHLGILGASRGYNNESTVTVWKLCRVYGHAKLISESEEIYLNDTLFSENEDDHNFPHSKDAMLQSFDGERSRMTRVSKYFSDRHELQIDAVGIVSIMNEPEHLNYQEPPEHGIRILWRNMYSRKIIPDEFYDGESDGVDEIIESTLNSNYYD